MNVADGRQARHGAIRPCSTFSGEASSGAPSSRMWIDLASSFHALRDQRRDQDRQDGIDRRPARGWMTIAATMAPTEPSRSPITCRMAPSR